MLTFLFDEHYRGRFADAVRRPTITGTTLWPLDVVCVGEPPDLHLRSPDPELLAWAEREGRLLVCRDRRTMPGHLEQHLTAGRHSPGVLLVRRGTTIPALIAVLEVIAYAGDPSDFRDACVYIPF